MDVILPGRIGVGSLLKLEKFALREVRQRLGEQADNPLAIAIRVQDAADGLHQPVIPHQHRGRSVQDGHDRRTAAPQGGPVHDVVVQERGIMNHFGSRRKADGVRLDAAAGARGEQRQHRPHHLPALRKQGTVRRVQQGDVALQGFIHQRGHFRHRSGQKSLDIGDIHATSNIRRVPPPYRRRPATRGREVLTSRSPHNGPGGP